MAGIKTYKNKICYVFGGSEGIGASLCEQLLVSGATVISLSRSSEKLETFREQIEQRYGENIEQKLKVYPIDVSDFFEVKESVEELVSLYGVPDYAFQCAGFARPGFLHEQDIQVFQSMMDTNYFGTVHIAKSLAPYWLEEKKGHFIACSSIAGFLGLFGYTGYCASKFAVIGFCEALKREWESSGIRISVICPPNTKTPGLTEENKFKPAEVLKTEEKVKCVEPEFVADYALKALEKNPFLIIPTFDGKMANYLNRFAPAILNRFVRRPSL
ncbi:MAG: SDR family oxidoreductase [Bdellovibrionales bacterium]